MKRFLEQLMVYGAEILKIIKHFVSFLRNYKLVSASFHIKI